MSQGTDENPGSGRDQQSSDPGAWDHLGRLIRERRAELGLTQREVHSVGGPSPATLYQLESGHRGSYRPHILRRLERALGWGAGSIRRVLEGGLPLLDGDGKVDALLVDRLPVDRLPVDRLPVDPPPQEERTNGADSREWMAGFRKLPIDTRDKLLILSTLLQETIADLDQGLDGRSHLTSRGVLGAKALPDLSRSGEDAGS
jgi:transcriptional regulator with XRE-family HTH domain